MDKNMFEICYTEFEDIQGMIEAISCRVAGSSLKRERIRDLIAEGWVYVLEMVPYFEPERGIKFTTYIWNHLNGRLLRAAIRMKELDDTEELRDIYCSTDSELRSCEFEIDPYRMQPDKVYDKTERRRLWQAVKEQETSSVQACLAETPLNADPLTRMHYSRQRRRRIARLQTVMAGMI